MKQYFITGTDTEVGKTYVTRLLLEGATALGKTNVGYKPIAAGCENVNGVWVNEDASAIQQASGIAVPINEINPIRLIPAIAPHIAAAEADIELSGKVITKGLETLQHYEPELLLMEGAGGWRLPLGQGVFLPDIISSLNMEVIMVVGMKLGCLNHAFLTAEAIIRDGLTLKGWVANDISGDMARYNENLATLKRELPAPLLLEVPYNRVPHQHLLFTAIEQLS
ncbi:dethiobiotin synthase [Alteromonas sp. 345S023]|uniref:ATP-dependent dethiobiotin synthetase BioD n=1 Tax=Alteromonas profundi TaxID=2696062 RepID=A0A7X5LKB7_9ALTE|nr:dethiobiotin synthase [Alteromonas profundi]NDV90938.1 dethiobiotin synthase [Alteromonas profundi]